MNDISISFSRPEENPEVSIISVRGYVDTTTSSELEESLKRSLGTKVEIRKRGRQGNIVVYFYSDDELDRLLDRLA